MRYFAPAGLAVAASIFRSFHDCQNKMHNDTKTHTEAVFFFLGTKIDDLNRTWCFFFWMELLWWIAKLFYMQ